MSKMNVSNTHWADLDAKTQESLLQEFQYLEFPVSEMKKESKKIFWSLFSRSTEETWTKEQGGRFDFIKGKEALRKKEFSKARVFFEKSEKSGKLAAKAAQIAAEVLWGKKLSRDEIVKKINKIDLVHFDAIEGKNESVKKFIESVVEKFGKIKLEEEFLEVIFQENPSRPAELGFVRCYFRRDEKVDSISKGNILKILSGDYLLSESERVIFFRFCKDLGDYCDKIYLDRSQYSSRVLSNVALLLAHEYREEGGNEKAIILIKEAVRKDREQTEGFAHYAMAIKALGQRNVYGIHMPFRRETDFSGYRYHIQKAFEKEFLDSYEEYGDLLFSDGKKKEALEVYQKAKDAGLDLRWYAQRRLNRGAA